MYCTVLYCTVLFILSNLTNRKSFLFLFYRIISKIMGTACNNKGNYSVIYPLCNNKGNYSTIYPLCNNKGNYSTVQYIHCVRQVS